MDGTVSATPRPTVTYSTNLLIDGKLVPGQGAMLAVENPATGQTFAQFPQASLAQLETTIAAARRTFESTNWKRDHKLRQSLLNKLADAIEANIDTFMAALIEEVGTPVTLCKAVQLGGPIRLMRYYASRVGIDRTRDLGPDAGPPASHSIIRYEPIGVVAAIAAYNYPIMIALAKAGAAIAAGCTAIILPSPQTPMATLLLAKLFTELGFPPGTISVLVGGVDIAKALSSHKEIDAVSFTGSVPVGAAIMHQAADTIKHVTLELGGKSGAILLPDADFARFVPALHGRYLRNAGQGCQSPTRIIVPEARFDEFVEASKAAYAAIKVGDPWDPATAAGPLISAAHRARVEGYVERALQAGGRVLAGGGRPDIAQGYYMNSTLIGGLDNTAEIAQNELFGPVGTVITYKTVEEAIAIANTHDLALAGYVYGPLEAAKEVGAQLRCGTLTINGGGQLRVDGLLCGWKQSGLGSEWGDDGIVNFLEKQHMQWATD